MLSWLFKKRGGALAAGTGTALPTDLQAPRETPAQQAQVLTAEWSARLQSAQADDEALLLVARTAPLLDIRCAAVNALGSEAALKRAERELRSHDSRVHRAAKLRLVAAVAQREARARATALIDAASAWSGDAPPAVNHLVALDRDWQALDANLLTADQLSAFTGLRRRIDAAMRAQGELQQRVRRWCADATQAVAELQRSATDADEDEASRLAASVNTLRQSRPEVSATLTLDQALQAALDAVLASARHASALAEEGRLVALAAAHGGNAEAISDVAPQPPPASAGPADAEQLRQLVAWLGQAEAALAEGQLGAMQQPLHALDMALQRLHAASLDERLRSRHRALHAEHARLRDWQQWGGAQALDGLVAEAIELAAATVAAADPAARSAPRLHLKTHAASIQALRRRWQETARLGAPLPASKWHLFDAALQTAYEPVAAQRAAMKAARAQNQRAREALLEALEAVPAQPPDGTPAEDAAAHWKAQLRALGDFQRAWRELGPVEHTIAAGARASLLERLRGSVERIEAPIATARGLAEAQREQLIDRAEALAGELLRNPAPRDAPRRVRELQAQWQQHARTLPLARAAEAALWARFKAATDAVFAQREAAFNARDAELAANLAAREALLLRIESIDPDADAAHVQRSLAEIDRDWRQPLELPGAAAAAIDARFRKARAAAAKALADAAQRRWQDQCDTLVAKLALCDEREAASSGEADLGARWAAHDALPAPWQQALEQRWSGPVAPGPLTERAIEDLLLQLEAALDLPASAEQQGARRDLKLRALKEAMEGRGAQPVDPAVQRARWVAAAVRQCLPTADQRQRLRAVTAALRRSLPGIVAN